MLLVKEFLISIIVSVIMIFAINSLINSGSVFSVFSNFGSQTKTGSVPESISGATNISASTLFSEIIDDSINELIIDVRSPAEFRNSHIHNAINIPSDSFSTKELANYTNNNYDQTLVIYCGGVNCGRSISPTKLAVSAGYQKVYWFRGGITAWRAENFPVSGNRKK